MANFHPVRRLPLKGAPNTRDLGGYPCAGGVTRWGAFLRSGSTTKMTIPDIQALKAYGVYTSVDLRSGEERLAQPSALEAAPGFTTHSVPMLDNMNSAHFEGDLPGSMAGLYISLLDTAGASFARLFSIFAAAQGGVLFHCAAGKDRTGVTAMLLLGLAGVPDPDIIADYASTDIYMREVFFHQVQALQDSGVPDYIFRSMPKSMERTLKHLYKTYGSSEQYLLGTGVTQQELDTIKEKLIDLEAKV